MKSICLSLFLTINNAILIEPENLVQNGGIAYPAAPRGFDSDDHSGESGQLVTIADPYRFLEDPSSKETKEWIKKEN